MYDTVRYVLLGLIFAGLFGLWLWSRRQAKLNGGSGSTLTAPFKVLRKQWLDQKTGICLVEAEEQTFLLAYTVGGSVSWQPLKKAAPKTKKTSNRLIGKSVLPHSAGQ